MPANERSKYSNIGYGMLGLVIEAASGMLYADYVRTEIAGWLGLTDFGPEYDPGRAAGYAVGYSSLPMRTCGCRSRTSTPVRWQRLPVAMRLLAIWCATSPPTCPATNAC